MAASRPKNLEKKPKEKRFSIFIPVKTIPARAYEARESPASPLRPAVQQLFFSVTPQATARAYGCERYSEWEE